MSRLHGLQFLNQTGGSFPVGIYAQSTFAYTFIDRLVSINYYGPSSTVGVCNIMGYWHTGNNNDFGSVIPYNKKTVDTAKCTDKCTIELCGYTPTLNGSITFDGTIYSGLPVRTDSGIRIPLTDIGATDQPLKPVDYFNFPDLQVFPAVAGAVVPIFNIPDFVTTNATSPLVLSRSTLVNIFLGRIMFWNDSRIGADNTLNALTKATLSKVTSRIRVVVRGDSSGTSAVFTGCLSKMSPEGFEITSSGLVPSLDNSFYSQVTPSGETNDPSWCGPLTDELQFITVTGCDSGISASLKSIVLLVVDSSYAMTNVTFACDASAVTIRSTILAATALDVFVSVTEIIKLPGPVTSQINIGYWGLQQQGKNMNNPIAVTVPIGVTLKIEAGQEGGYLNTATTCAKVPAVVQIMGVWVLTTASATFTLSWVDSGIVFTTTMISMTAGQDISTLISTAINTLRAGSVSSVTKITHGTWMEYQVTFTSSTKNIFSSLTSIPAIGSVHVTSLLAYLNYPCFEVPQLGRKAGASGYLCYRRQHNFKAWKYYVGLVNSGLIAQVHSTPYSIGYSVLDTAIALGTPTASMINKAGYVVAANAESVSRVLDELGKELNSELVANLGDASNDGSWPMATYTYFVIRKNHHIAAGDCARRRSAMEYLYDFYTSPALAASALSLGFTTLSSSLVYTIRKKLVDTAMCDNGEYALSRHRERPTPIMTTRVFGSTVGTYISAYANVDQNSKWDVLKSSPDSRFLWPGYLASADSTAGIFTMFADREEKMRHFNVTGVVTSAFASVSVMPLYNLRSSKEISASQPIQVTAEIIGGILGGSISHWNDTQIKAANPTMKDVLPYLPITVVVRSFESDTSRLMMRFLLESSPTFLGRYRNHSPFQFSQVIPPSRLKFGATNYDVDSLVNSIYGSFGYFAHNDVPLSSVARYCKDSVCAAGPLDPSDSNSVLACNTAETIVQDAFHNVNTKDLMSSTAALCYPIVGTVDYSFLSTSSMTCDSSGVAPVSALDSRIKIASWLYSFPTYAKNVASSDVVATPDSEQLVTYRNICDIECNGKAYGYHLCGYRKCTWRDGDIIQVEGKCDAQTEMKIISYELVPGSTCIKSPGAPYRTYVSCSEVLLRYRTGQIVTTLSIIGTTLAVIAMYLAVKWRHNRTIKKSQPMFIFIFIFGSLCLNLSINTLLGPHSDTTCLLRPWTFNLSATTMFAPLLMKLHRIDTLYRHSKKLKKTSISDSQVALQVLGLLSVDIFILVLWTALSRPVLVYFEFSTVNVEDALTYSKCSTGIQSEFEQLMIAWKALLLAVGVYKSVRSWDKPADVAEVKHFFLAIYNMSVAGGSMYLFSSFSARSESQKVFLQSIGIFISATLPLLIIMIPKFIAIFGNNNGKRSFESENASQGVKEYSTYSAPCDRSPLPGKGVVSPNKGMLSSRVSPLPSSPS